MSERASIIIPTYNGLGVLQRCVESVRSHTTEIHHELIVADDASTDGTLKWCLKQGIAFVSLPRKMGYPAACNHGLRIANGETLVLLGNDTVVTPGWLDNMSTALYSEPDVGIVGPVMNDADGAQQANYPYEDLAEFQRVAAQVNVSKGDLWKPVERIAGICLVFKRGVMKRIGLLDGRFAPGRCEDNYCSRARSHDYRLLVCQDTLIYHEGSVSDASGRADDEDERR